MMSAEVLHINKQDLDLIHFNLEFEYFKKMQLILIVGKPGCGKSKLLRVIHEMYKDGPIINLGLELSRKLIEAEDVDFYNALYEIIGGFKKVYLDNLEILYDPYLNKDPLRELLNLAKNNQVVATLTGEVKNGILCYSRDMRVELNDLSSSLLINIREG